MLIVEKLSNQQKMTETEINIAQYLLNIGHDIKNNSTRSIAKELFISPSTVSRFCQLIGFSGFSEFQQHYLEEIRYLESKFQSIDPNQPFNEIDKNKRLASKVGALYKETIEDTVELLHHDSLQKAERMLHTARELYVGSAGDTFDLANVFKNRCLKIGKKVTVEIRNDNLFYQACYAPNDSCFILISYSGETAMILKVAEKLRERQIPTIVITSYGDNQLSQLFETVLYISTHEKLVENLGNFSSLLSVHFILDVLYASIFNTCRQENYENRIRAAYEFEQARKSKNPLIRDS